MTRFSPTSWHRGAQQVEAAAADLAGSAQATLGQLANVATVVPGPRTQTDVAVVKILQSLAMGASQTVLGISRGLVDEAATMHGAADDYQRCEDAAEWIAGKVGR